MLAYVKEGINVSGGGCGGGSRGGARGGGQKKEVKDKPNESEVKDKANEKLGTGWWGQQDEGRTSVYSRSKKSRPKVYSQKEHTDEQNNLYQRVRGRYTM
jgi:hypothetical protein